MERPFTTLRKKEFPISTILSYRQELEKLFIFLAKKNWTTCA